MKITSIILLISLVVFSKAEAQKNKFQGTYIHYYGKDSESPYRLIEIYYSDSANILFYLEIGNGAPSYNSGSIYGRLKNNMQNGHLEFLPADTVNSCKLDVSKKGNNIVIKTVSGECGFGNGVYADGEYFIQTPANPPYFTNRKGKKIYFNKISPEEYLE